MPISRSLCARVTFPKNRSNAHPPATHHSERTADNNTTLSSGVGAPQDSWLGRSTAGIQPSPVRICPLPLHAVVALFPMHRHILRGIDSDPHLIAFDSHHRHFLRLARPFGLPRPRLASASQARAVHALVNILRSQRRTKFRLKTVSFPFSFFVHFSVK